jgi:hypothetical protein
MGRTATAPCCSGGAQQRREKSTKLSSCFRTESPGHKAQVAWAKGASTYIFAVWAALAIEQCLDVFRREAEMRWHETFSQVKQACQFLLSPFIRFVLVERALAGQQERPCSVGNTRTIDFNPPPACTGLSHIRFGLPLP